MSPPLPKGFRRFTRHYSGNPFVVERPAAAHMYGLLLDALRRVPSSSPPSSLSDLDAVWSSWVSSFDSSVSVWRLVFSSDDARRQYTPFFVYDLSVLDYESIAIWRRFSKFVPLDSNDRVFPASTDRPPSLRPDADESSGVSGESDTDQTRSAGKRPQPPSPGPVPLASAAAPSVDPPPKRTRITGEILPLAPSIIDPVLLDPSVPRPSAALDPNRVRSSLFIALPALCLTLPSPVSI